MPARLFQNCKKIIFLLFFFLGWSASAQEYRFIEEVNLRPAKLEYFRDSVRFQLEGSIPIESVVTPRNPRLTLSLKAAGNILELGEISLEKNLSKYTYSESYRFAFEPWMQESFLELSFFQGKREQSEPFEKRVLAKGIITTPFLAKVGRFAPSEEIQDVGLFIPGGVADRGNDQTVTYLIQFRPGSSDFEATRANEAQLSQLREFVTANPDITSIKITGIQSPENQEGKLSRLGMERAEAVKSAILNKNIILRDSLIDLEARWNDWFDFRLLLSDYEQVSTSVKDQLYDILMNGEDYLTQQESLKRVRGFDQVSRDLYPKLRAAKIEVRAKPGRGIGMQKMAILEKELNGNSSVSELSFVDWATAAESSARMNEKTEIYTKMTELFRSVLPYNNLAVIKMREAQRTFDEDIKENLWTEAEWLLNQAIRLEPNGYSLHNKGQIAALRGNFWEAYRLLSEASTLTKNADFLKRNEALRGALDIIRGDYKLATLRFDYSFDNAKDLFNKGLAFFLAGDFSQASIAFEESVIQNRSFGYGYYGLALLAINAGQKEVALIQLKRAVSLNEELYRWMLYDPSFEEIRGMDDFFESERKTQS
ncbi:MAG: hypothetical protein NXH89_02235 [Cyclobacteriaceae bacterium]|nr:hypothetical protein [Cyclobacteriaceae bacterium]